jgi:hypothetical protein
MPLLRETINTRLPIDETFAFVADFANNAVWDPNSATSVRIDDGPAGGPGGSGPVRVGTRYALSVRQGGKFVPMEYRVTAWEPGRRVVLEGVGPGVRATDDIRFEATPTGTRVDYTADITLTGLMRLATPFAGGAFAKIAQGAAAGMARELEARAEAAAR